MADYIDRQEAINLFSCFLEQGEYIPPEYLVQKLMELPAKKAREDVHGKWKPTEYPIMSECEDCSVCGYRAVYGHNYKFCPNCGADMRNKDTEE